MAPRVPYTWRLPDFPGDGSDLKWIDPSLLVICQNGNVEAAVQPLLQTLKQPFAPRLVASVFCHETMREPFKKQVVASMELLHRHAGNHSQYKKACRMIECLNAEIICILYPDFIGFHWQRAASSPVIVCEFDHSFFGGKKPTSIVTLHTFRNVQELPGLMARERIPFVSAAVWCPKMSAAYETAFKLGLDVVYINCDSIPLGPIMEFFLAKQPHVILANYHHYEVVRHGDNHRLIVFPAVVLWRPPEPQPPQQPQLPEPPTKEKTDQDKGEQIPES
ncbi:uncharacterized protein Dana_GF21434 [Drosophila ananassae]|uniref:Uncharacterized protein n=1 Tax=Drosophila ananassae TaxID=7217 RepID=B3MSB3_DROAN|nr:uncharacterized protein LOC6504117 [Drosophila ananassae]EDV34668.1 uncharacterized protein Dana_GF21434 [Drosophila ananassae]